MAFTDTLFLYLFLPVCIACYYLAKTRWRNAVLIGFSLLFYAWGEPVYLWLLLLSTCLNYVFGRMISYSGEKLAAKLSLILAMLLNVGLLFSFRCAGALTELINTISGAALPVPETIIPLGLSFYSLRGISYAVDCYRGKVLAESHFSSFLLYMTLFPIVSQGPVIRYEDVQMQLRTRYTGTADLSEGLERIAIGLGKKVLLADRLAGMADKLLLPDLLETQSALGAWCGAALFALRFYFDLSGYSDIALGLGRIFGFRFAENFRHPFLCRSMTEFWERWHVSLNTFFRDYVLRSSVCGNGRILPAILLAAVIGGIWHGAAWSFVLWGLFCGLIVLLEKAVGEERLEKIPAAVRHIYSKLMIILSFGIFWAARENVLPAFLRNLFFIGEGGAADASVGTLLLQNLPLLAAAILCCFPLYRLARMRMQSCTSTRTYILMQTICILFAAVLLIFSGISLAAEPAQPFVYTNF